MRQAPEIKCIYYGAHYTGGKIMFFQDKKELIFAYRNYISVINLTFGSIRTISFQLRSNILTFDVDNIESRILIIDSSNLLIMVNIKNNKIISKMILARRCQYIKCSPMGRYFAIGAGRKIEIWKFSSLRLSCQCIFQLSRVYNAHYSDISTIDWSSDGKFFISLSLDKTIKIFSFRKQGNFPKIVVNLFQKKLYEVRFNFRSKNFLVLDENNVLSEWSFLNNLEKSKDITFKIYRSIIFVQSFRLLTHKLRILCVWLHIFSNVLFTVFVNGQVSYFLIPKTNLLYKKNQNKKMPINKKIIFQVKLFKLNNIDVSFLCGCLNSNLIAIGRKGKKEILVYDWIKKKIIVRHQSYISEITCLSLSPNDNLVCVGNRKGYIIVWSLVSGFPIIKFHNHISRVNRIIFLENNSRLIIASSADGTVKTYDLKKCLVTRSVSSLFPCKNFDALGIDKTGSIIASACAKTFLIFIWSLKNGSLIEMLKGHQLTICDLHFSREGLKLITGSMDKSLRVWYIEDRIGKNKDCHCEIFRTGREIIAMGYHPIKDEVVVLDSSYYVSSFRIKRNLAIINVSQSIKKNKLDFLLNSEFDRQFSLDYSFDGKKLFITDSKHVIYSFQYIPFLFLCQYQVFPNIIKEVNNKKFQNKNCVKFSRKKNLYLILFGEEFCSVEETITNFALNQISDDYIIIFERNGWKKTFEWIIWLNNEDFFLLSLKSIPLILAKSFINSFFMFRFKYIDIFEVGDIIFQTKQIITQYFNLFGANFINFLIKINKRTKNFNFSTDLKNLRKFLYKRFGKLKYLIFKLLNFPKIPKFSTI
nr:guanine nucleotide-binding protein beta SU like protein [Cryptomonas sp.]